MSRGYGVNSKFDATSDDYRSGHDRIYGKKEAEPTTPELEAAYEPTEREIRSELLDNPVYREMAVAELKDRHRNAKN